jgi:cysteine desulfurase
MTLARTYLDHNASAPLKPEARAAMLAALDGPGNPSSVHAEGRAARAIVETGREQVAALVGCRPSEVVFTSSASEANAWVMAAGWDLIACSGIEHDSVLAPVRASGSELVDLPAASDGVVRVEALADRVLRGPAVPARALVSLQLANNETGVVQAVAETAAFARAHGLATHTDAVQAVGRMPVDFEALGVDFLSVSSHKLGGPKGVGALVIRDRIALGPLIAGGGQERRRRAGTENVAGIAGFGAAAAAARSGPGAMARLGALRDRLEREAKAIAPATVVIGATGPRIANTTCIALPGAAAETLVIRLDLMGLAVSAGAACSSGKVGASHVLAAMGLEPALARSAIRVSLGWSTAERDIDVFLAAWAEITSAARTRSAVA